MKFLNIQNNKNKQAVRVSHYKTVAPTLRVPIAILRSIDVDFNDYIDIMVDTKIKGETSIGIIKGISLKVLTVPDTKEVAQIRSTALAEYIPKMVATIARHKMFTVNDAIPGLLIYVPQLVEIEYTV